MITPAELRIARDLVWIRWGVSSPSKVTPDVMMNAIEAYGDARAAAAVLAERERSEAMRAALVELVACKDLKDEITTLRSDPYYITQADFAELDYARRKPLAWAAARAAIRAEPKEQAT